VAVNFIGGKVSTIKTESNYNLFSGPDLQCCCHCIST